MKEEAGLLLEKAERALHAAQTLLDEGDAEFAAGRVYYAMLYTAQSLLRSRDFQFRKHSSVHAMYGQHFAKTGELDPKYHRRLLDAYDERLQGDYNFQIAISIDSVRNRLAQAREFLKVARDYLKN